MGKEKTILVDYKVKGELLKLGSYPTIKKALQGDVRTPQKINIRAKAIELGGIIQESKEDEVSNYNDESSNCTPLI